MAFFRGATGLSHLPSCFELILGVTVQSVQGNQVYLEWIGTSGFFCIVQQPLEFLSSFKLRQVPLEVRRERWHIFPNELGKWTSSRDEEGKTGLFLSCGRTLGVPLEWRQVCLGTCLDATMVSRTLSRLKRESGIFLETPQWKRASSCIEERIF